jgi:chlorite dismutase
MTDATTGSSERPRAYSPETTEGWYALHQILSWDRTALRALPPEGVPMLRRDAQQALESLATHAGGGWSAVCPLIGSRADVMLIHFRPTLDEIGAAQRAVARIALLDVMRTTYTFLSITEAGLYHASAHLAREAVTRGGAVGDEIYTTEMAKRVADERMNPHIRRRLFPVQPPEMPYVSFYPMSKRRTPGQNWYALTLDERSRLMIAHGATGRTYAGRVVQVITGAIGFDAWEWGVTLFATDPLMFKKIVTDMRFDEVSAEYAEFGEFFVGKTVTPTAWVESLSL